MTARAKTSCEICGGKRFRLITTKMREGYGRIMKCPSCGLVMQDLGWGSEKLGDYYGKEYQQTNSLVTGKIQTAKEHFTDRLTTIRPIFENIRTYLKPTSRILELGCGAGSLLSLVKPHVAKCVGVELHKPFVDFIKKDLRIEAYARDLGTLEPEEPFDLIISIATLDHLPNPYDTLLSMKRLLAKKGRIYIEVPSCEQALNLFLPKPNSDRFNEFFWHRAHLFYFDRKTITKLFKKAGFDIAITCRHDYTLKNFLNWYFAGSPQPSLVSGMTDVALFSGNDEFEKKMNMLFGRAEKEFREIMAKTYRGESLCCTGTPKTE